MSKHGHREKYEKKIQKNEKITGGIHKMFTGTTSKHEKKNILVYCSSFTGCIKEKK